MRIGMLWFDDNKSRDLADKIGRAAEQYEAKHGQRPTVCYVHPSMLIGATSPIDGIEIKGSNIVLPHHLWIGCSDDRKPVYDDRVDASDNSPARRHPEQF